MTESEKSSAYAAAIVVLDQECPQLNVRDHVGKKLIARQLMRSKQGVRNRREIQLTRFALPYDYTCFADDTPFVKEIFRIGYCIRGNCTSDKYFLYK